MAKTVTQVDAVALQQFYFLQDSISRAMDDRKSDRIRCGHRSRTFVGWNNMIRMLCHRARQWRAKSGAYPQAKPPREQARLSRFTPAELYGKLAASGASDADLCQTRSPAPAG